MDLNQGEKTALQGAFGEKPNYGTRPSRRASIGVYEIDGDEDARHFQADQEGKLLWSSETERSGLHNMTLSWSDITTTVKIPGKRSCFGESIPATKKTILDHVDGVVSPGTVLAVMGPRGCGKSTLLNVLTSRNIEGFSVSGSIRINGVQTHANMKDISAYVQQDDVFINLLTVREQLQFRAMLKMDKKLTREQRLARAEEVIREVGLTNCADTRIGSATGSEKGISGGERKRLSFACEVLTNPPIFFCDEPTTGLDSFMAYEIVKALQKMALRGRAVISTIQQPSSEVFAMFSQVLLLSEGKTAFIGTTDEALDFFSRLNYPCPETFNPADHFIMTLSIAPGKEMETKKRADAICDAFRETDAHKAQAKKHEILEKEAKTSDVERILTSDKQQSRYQPTLAMQLSQLSWRAWTVLLRNPQFTRMKIASSLAMSLMIGLTYFQLDVDQKGVQDINGSLFLVLVIAGLSNQYPVLTTFPDEMEVVMRDYGSAVHGITGYYLTKSLSELLSSVFDILLFATINYWMIGYQDTFEAYAFTCLCMVLFSWGTTAIGYSIAIVSGRTSVALAVNTPVVLVSFLFGGFFLNDSSVPVYMKWLRDISVFKYGYKILMSYQWKDVDVIECDVPGNITGVSEACPFRSGADVLNYQKIDKDDIAKNFAILGGLFTGLYIFALTGLLIRGRRAKS